MSFRLACELSDRIAAIGSVAGVITHSIAQACRAHHKMPVIMIHGTQDLWVPYGGTPGWHSVEYTINHWVSFNLCTESDTLFMPDLNPSDGCTVVRIRYRHPSDSVSMVLCKVINGGHSWPGGDETQWSGPDVGNTNMDINSSAEIWNFVKSYRLPPATGVGTCCGDPVEFSLSQNYPNPFNPSTTIKYELAQAAMVRLSVYDLLGREVAVLVNKREDAGVHQTKFDASNLASGVYLYRLQAGDFLQSRKLLVLR